LSISMIFCGIATLKSSEIKPTVNQNCSWHKKEKSSVSASTGSFVNGLLSGLVAMLRISYIFVNRKSWILQVCLVTDVGGLVVYWQFEIGVV
jgi:hypothetical protein